MRKAKAWAKIGTLYVRKSAFERGAAFPQLLRVSVETADSTRARNFKLPVSKRRASFTILPRKVASFYVRPPNLWRTLWRTYFVFELSAGRSGRI
jgi:hypothetical protein